MNLPLKTFVFLPITDMFSTENAKRSAVHAGNTEGSSSDKSSEMIASIRLFFFEGIRKNGMNILTWQIECRYAVTILLERSYDNISFKAIKVQTATSQHSRQPFQYNDHTFPSNNAWYRLKLVAPDSSVKHSDTIYLSNNAGSFDLESVTPNPVKCDAIVTVNATKCCRLYIRIFGPENRIVSFHSMNVVAGTNNLPFSMQNLATGIYNVCVSNEEDEMRTLRVRKV